jgi:hypothetical protein
VVVAGGGHPAAPEWVVGCGGGAVGSQGLGPDRTDSPGDPSRTGCCRYLSRVDSSWDALQAFQCTVGDFLGAARAIRNRSRVSEGLPAASKPALTRTMSGWKDRAMGMITCPRTNPTPHLR